MQASSPWHMLRMPITMLRSLETTLCNHSRILRTMVATGTHSLKTLDMVNSSSPHNSNNILASLRASQKWASQACKALQVALPTPSKT